MAKKKKEATGLLVAVSPITIKEREQKYGGGLLDSDRQQYQEGDEVVDPWTEEDKRRWTEEGGEGINDPVNWTEAEIQQRERVDETQASYQQLLLKNAEALAASSKFDEPRNYGLFGRGRARNSRLEEYFNEAFKNHLNTATWAGTTLPHSTAQEGLAEVRNMAKQIIEEREALKEAFIQEHGQEAFDRLVDKPLGQQLRDDVRSIWRSVTNRSREEKQSGGLLMSDRQQYQEAGPVMPLPEETEEPIVPEPIIASEEAVPPEKGAVPSEEGKVVPDEQMEDEYLDFVISQSLDEEEETYLMDTLEADPKLSMIFDKIMDTATEFAGSGPVEGPGTEVSDSIPARLSDGEFVMTAKAADEIGPDNLQGMMSDAELRADQRQAAQEGGLIRPDFEEETDELGRPINQEIRKGMLGVNPRLQATG